MASDNEQYKEFSPEDEALEQGVKGEILLPLQKRLLKSAFSYFATTLEGTRSGERVEWSKLKPKPGHKTPRDKPCKSTEGILDADVQTYMDGQIAVAESTATCYCGTPDIPLKVIRTTP